MSSPKRIGFVVGLAAALAAPLGAAGSGVPFGVIIAEQAQASFDLVGAGARAAGMGGAFTAVADDATAASFNPAGLAQLLVPEASIVGRRRTLRDHFLDFSSFDQTPVLPLTDSSTRFDRDDLNFLSLTLPFRRWGHRWAFQLSTQELVDFTYEAELSFFETSLDGTPLFALEQRNRQDGSIHVLSTSLAVELTERTLVGVTINRWDGSWRFSSFNAESAVETPDVVEQFLYRQDNDLSGWNADLGLLLRYPRFNVGLRYRLPFTASYRFESQLDTDLQVGVEPAGRTRTHLDWPASLDVGIAVRPTDRWTIAVDWSRTDWQRMRFRLSELGDEVSFFDLETRDRSGASTVETWRAGSEVVLLAGSFIVPLRVGAFREPQPSRDPVTSDRAVSTGLAAGVGLKRGPIAVDLAVVRKTSRTEVARFLEPDEIESGVLRPTSRGIRDREETEILLSLIVQAPAGSSVERLLHRVFVGPLPRGGGKGP